MNIRTKLKCIFKWDLSGKYIINFARGLRVGVDAKGSGKVPFFPIGMENASNRTCGEICIDKSHLLPNNTAGLKYLNSTPVYQ